jgi:hypothetical protein
MNTRVEDRSERRKQSHVQTPQPDGEETEEDVAHHSETSADDGKGPRGRYQEESEDKETQYGDQEMIESVVEDDRSSEEDGAAEDHRYDEQTSGHPELFVEIEGPNEEDGQFRPGLYAILRPE